jgi:sec-independent protein translocase protein TatA
VAFFFTPTAGAFTANHGKGGHILTFGPLLVGFLWLHLSFKPKKVIMSHTLLLSMPGGTEWIIIVLAVLILFGGRKIPEFMRGLGRGMREFKDAKDNIKSEIEAGMKEKE